MSEKDTFLFELYTEEIPSFYQIRAISDWKEKLTRSLGENLLKYSVIETGGTSRRIYALINDLGSHQIIEKKKIKGPPQELCIKDGRSTNALAGFAKKVGINDDAVTYENWDGKMYATAEMTVGGKPVSEVLPAIFENLIAGQAFVRSMRWGSSTTTYARPIIHYTAMFGSKQMKFSSGLWDKITHAEYPAGHFILGPEKVTVGTASKYLEALETCGQSNGHNDGIIAQPEKRRNYILKMLHDIAGKNSVIMNDTLLDEVNFLVEKPVVIRGSFPHEFLQMPDVVILSEMEQHQKYFGLMQSDGVKISNEFLIVANANPNDTEALENIRRGNEKVLRARLADGSYFFHEDCRKKLVERVDDLKRMVFHEGMGSIFEKKERIKKIAKIFSRYVYPDVNSEKLSRTCDLIKADLTTRLVYEFDHLQGKIGSIYAGMDKEDTEIACAIFEHYLPRNENDGYPRSKMGLLLSFSDKFDNILSGFILGKQPTASQDPLGLRRQTLYIIEMLIQNKIVVSMSQIFTDFISEIYKPNTDHQAMVRDLIKFFKGRLATIFEKEDFDRKFINAALGTDNENIFGLFLILDVLREFKDDERFLKVVDGFRRMNNIVKDFSTKNKDIIPGFINEQIFELDQEEKLYKIYNELNYMVAGVSGKDRSAYAAIFNYLASIKQDIDNFFDHVMVMHEKNEIKMNRLAILNQAVKSVRTLINIEILQ